MKRTSIKLALLGATALLPALQAKAIDYNWNVLAGGSQSWLTATNWTPNGVPNAISSVANLSVPLTGDLNVNVGTAPITLGGLDIGSTGTALTTEISAGVGGKIILSNHDDPDFNDDNRVNGDDLLIWQRNLGLNMGAVNANGDANGDGIVNSADLRSWRQAFGVGNEVAPPVLVPPGRPVINSNGVVGAINTISAPVRSGIQIDAVPTYREEVVEIRGTRSINFSGGYLISGVGNTVNSHMPDGATTFINGITLEEDSELTPTTNRTIGINTQNGSTGRIEVNGPITGGGSINIGTTGANNALSTVVLSGNNTHTGQTQIHRVNLILGHPNAAGNIAGGANFRSAGATNATGNNIVSSDDSLVVGGEFSIGNAPTFTGANSLTLSGPVFQTNNNRGIINILPAGKQLSLTGNVYAFSDPDNLSRVFVFDGSGKTVVTGAVPSARYNATTDMEVAAAAGANNNFVKRGPGALYLNGQAAGVSTNTYTGGTTVDGGNFHFGLYDDVTATQLMLVNFGAIGATAFKSFGVDDTLQTNAFFLARISAESTGGLMVNPSDADPGDNFDFTANANIAKMSLAAPEGGLTYNGTITPANATYRLGGGSGTITLPSAQLTGANSVIATNGGVVQLNGANTYSGTTSAIAKYVTSSTGAALVNGSITNTALTRSFAGTVIATNNLQNGGVNSGIGSSSNVANNLVVQGSTFRYNGAGASTDRLFTVGTGGGTIESSGAGAVVFNNTGNLGMDEPESRTGTTSGTALTAVANRDDLVIGMGVSGPGIAPNTTISSINNPGLSTADPPAAGTPSITLNTAVTTAGTDTLSFTSIARTLTLGGSNGGDNTLRPNIVNGAAATNIVKADGGKWILTGNNTYTGTTTVNGGTLLVNGTHTGGVAYTVATGAILGGEGSIGTTTITVNGELSPGNPLTDGVLTVTGGATFNAGSTLRLELAGPNPGDFDELNLSGALVAGGTFDVDLLGGYVPGIGASFDVLDFTPAATGTFTFSLPALPVGRIWNTSSVLTTGTISVQAGIAAVPEPSSIVLVASCLAAVAAGRSRRRAVAAR